MRFGITEKREPFIPQHGNVQADDEHSPGEDELEVFVLGRGTRSSVSVKGLSMKAQRFLEQINLTAKQIKEAGIDPVILDQILNRKFSGRVLRWLAIERAATKILMYPFLDARGIEEEIIIPEARSCRGRLGEWFQNRVWPRATSVPFKSEKNLRRTYGITAFADGTDSVLTGVWSALLFSFIGADLYDYYANPDLRYGTTLFQIFLTHSEKEISLTRTLTSLYVWPELVGLPLLWGIIQAFRSRCRAKKLESDELGELLQTLKNYKPGVFQDVFQWLLPINQLSDTLAIIQRILLWDNRLTGAERRSLTTTLIEFVQRSHKLSQHVGIQALSSIVDSVSRHDMRRLIEAGTLPETVHEILLSKSRALAELQRLRQQYLLDPNASGYYQKYFQPMLLYITTQFALWKIGQTVPLKFQIAFWLHKAAQLYAKMKFFYMLAQGVQVIIQRYLDKKTCEENGLLWMYMDRVSDYVCSFCGDFPVYYRNIFTAKDCLSNYLHVARNVTDIVRLLNRIQPTDNITIVDFYRQPLGDETHTLENVLPIIHKRIPTLEILRLNPFLPSRVGSLGAKAIAAFLTISHLKELYLTDQQIGVNGTVAIASALPNSTLQILNLYGNGIGDQGVQALAAVLSKSMLRSITLAYNGISYKGAEALASALPNSILEELDLSLNHIGPNGAKSVALALPNSTLRIFSLYNDLIGADGAKALALGLPGSKLQDLGLVGGYIGDEGAKALALALPNSTLRSLQLYSTYDVSNNIGLEGTKSLASTLPNSMLQELWLGSNNINVEGAKALALALPNSLLQVLDLGDCNIGAEGAKALAQILPNSMLQRLSLNINNIGVEGTKALATTLPNSTLQVLDLSLNSIGVEGVRALALSLAKSTLQKLSLQYNFIDDEGANILVSGLPNSRLKSLDLFSNSIGLEGAKALAIGLPKSILQELILWGNKLSDEGAEALSPVFSSLTLKKLDLGYNLIGDKGAKALASALPKTMIEELRLNQNNIGDEGAKAIASVLTTMPMNSYSIWINSLDPDMKRVLAQAAPNTNLASLDLWGNKINTTGAIALCRVLPQTKINFSPISTLNDNPVNPKEVDTTTCVISSASHVQPTLPFRVITEMYSYTTHQMNEFYVSVKFLLGFVDHLSSTQSFSESGLYQSHRVLKTDKTVQVQTIQLKKNGSQTQWQFFNITKNKTLLPENSEAKQDSIVFCLGEDREQAVCYMQNSPSPTESEKAIVKVEQPTPPNLLESVTHAAVQGFKTAFILKLARDASEQCLSSYLKNRNYSEKEILQ